MLSSLPAGSASALLGWPTQVNLDQTSGAFPDVDCRTKFGGEAGPKRTFWSVPGLFDTCSKCRKQACEVGFAMMKRCCQAAWQKTEEGDKEERAEQSKPLAAIIISEKRHGKRMRWVFLLSWIV